MSKNVPFDVAFTIDDATRMGWAIHFGIQDGGTFNWGTMSWEKR